MINRWNWRGAALGTVMLLLLALALPALAQDEALELRLSRDFGYGGLNNDIQGTFSYRVSGPDDLTRVEFLMDGEVIGEDSEAPFAFQFNTGAYSTGLHQMQAVGYLADDSVLESNTVERNFVEAGAGTQEALRFVVPLLVVIAIAVLIPAVFSIVSARRNPVPLGAPRKYGVMGGAICPNCSRPFGIHWWSLNMVGARLDRCPHCGKFHRVRRASQDELRAAEKAEVASEQVEETPVSEEERLRRLLDDSRFNDVD